MRLNWLRSVSSELSPLLALVILLGSLPLMTGLCIIGGPEHPQLSLDVCHPVQSFNLAGNVLIAPPASAPDEPAIVPQGYVADPPPAKLIEISLTPDLPPPKKLS